MTAGMSPGLDAVLGVIPSFFAAICATVVLYMGKQRPLRAAAFGAGLVAATEIIQPLGLPNYTFDPADMSEDRSTRHPTRARAPSGRTNILQVFLENGRYQFCVIH
jgi:hypothetical protein